VNSAPGLSTRRWKLPMQANSSQRSVSERENKPMQRAVLAYLLFEFPRKLKREDLERRSAFDGPIDDVIHLLHSVRAALVRGRLRGPYAARSALRLAGDAVTVAERFAANLVAARERAGLTQEEVSLRAELHRTEVSQLERGLRVPPIDTLTKLAGALNLETGALLVGIDWTPGRTLSGSFSEYPASA
jgi:DNA-binding XRE family transcriptional regulator